jgi:4-hydroxybenzoate polyprenyltransferase
VKSLWRDLRVPDWGVQLLIGPVVAFVYWRVAGLAAGPFTLQVLKVTLWSVVYLAGGYMVNNHCDRFADRRKTRPQSGPGLSPRHTLLLAAGGVVASLGALPLLFPQAPVRAVGAAAVAAGLAYSLPWPRLKERSWLGMLTAAVTQRLPAFLMTVLAFPDQPAALLALAAWLVVLGLVFILEHQLADRADDLGAGVRTWATGRGRMAGQLARHRLYRVYRWATLGAGLILLATAPGWSGLTAAGVLAAGGYLLEFAAWRRYLGNRDLPRRGEISRPAADRSVLIRGGGLAGLTAATKLAQWGWKPVVQEWQPAGSWLAAQETSVHAVRFDPAFIETYLDLPLDGCFSRVTRENMYLSGRLRGTSSPHWVCRRGRGLGTIDSYLTGLARQAGVVFEPPSGHGYHEGRDEPPDILATGLALDTFADLGLEHDLLSGYWASGPAAGPSLLLNYLGPFTHPNYGYVATCGDTAYALIFSRKGVSTASLAEFQRQLEATEGLSFIRWNPMRGAVPRQCRLTRGGSILAGTLAGMMDPFWYSGVSGALLSGGLAALAVAAPELARAEHRRFTGNFRLQLALADLGGKLPWRLALGLWAVNGVIDPAGSLGRWCGARGQGRQNLVHLPAPELKKKQARSGG